MPKQIFTCRMPLLQRFWRRVEKSSGCWIWTGYVDYWGYGRFRGFDGKKILTHRFSWEIHNGPIPPGNLVLHRCDVTRCVNPAHLFLGTNSDNCHDRDLKWRLSHKLTEEEIRKIRAFGYSVSGSSLAAMFGVSRSNIDCVRSGKTWRHVK